MRFSLVALALAGLALLSAPAKADTFSFTATGGYTGSGTLTASSNGDGSFQVTGISGTGITGLLPVNSGDIFLNDNLLLPGQPRLLTEEGIAFSTLLSGLAIVNLYSDYTGSYFALVEDSSGVPTFASETFSVAATPEPSSLLLLGTGLVGVGAALVRRRRVASGSFLPL